MVSRSVEILTQLKAEVWWPWDRRGDRDGGYNLRPQRQGLTDDEYKAQMAEYAAAPNINRNRWFAMIGELIALNPQSRDVRELRRLYQQGASHANTKAREMLLEAMLR